MCGWSWPSALLAKLVGSFMYHYGNIWVGQIVRYRSKSTEIWLWRRKFSSHSCWWSNLWPSGHESSIILLSLHWAASLLWQYYCINYTWLQGFLSIMVLLCCNQLNVFFLTFTIHRYKTFFPHIVGEDSLILLKTKVYTVYTVGKNSHMTFT